MKSPMCSFVVDSYEWMNIETRQDCRQLENYLQFLSYSDRRQVNSKGKI